MSTRDIKDQIKGLYDVEISEGLVSKISERILPKVTEWHTLRPFWETDPLKPSIHSYLWMRSIIKSEKIIRS